MTNEQEENAVAETADQAAKKDATVWELAQIIAGSRDFPECRSPEKAAVRILAGREMGVGPIASVLGIRIQNGRLSMDAGLVAGLIDRSAKYRFAILEHTEDVCRLEFFADNQSRGMAEFGTKDAERAGLAKKDTWLAYPKNLRFARALTNGARWYCPGIFGGSVYTHEELGYQVDEDGRAMSGDDAGGAGGGGSDLCTREQREEIRRLVAAAGKDLAGVLADLGVRLLDELSGYEAGKLIKKLAKQTQQTQAAPGNAAPTAAKTEPAAVGAQTSPPPAGGGESANDAAAKQMMQDSFDAINRQIDDEQRERIFALAEQLIPGDGEDADAERCGMLGRAIAKRGRRKLAELSWGQADELIRSMEALLADQREQPPFDPGQQVAVAATAK